MPDLKKCPRCGLEKPIEEFVKSHSKKPYCRDCNNEYNRERYYARHPEAKKRDFAQPQRWNGSGDLEFCRNLPGSPWKKPQ
jgi:hypothetical protein